MRILHWYPNFLEGGGVSNAVLGLVLAQAQVGADVRLAAARTRVPPLYGGLEAAEPVLDSWEPRWELTRGPISLRWLPRRARRELAAWAPDVVHVHAEFNPDNAWAPIVCRGRPLVLSPHGAFDPLVLGEGQVRGKKAYVRTFGTWLYRHTDMFHAASPREAEHVARFAGSRPVYVAPHGVAFPETPPTRSPRPPGAPLRLIYVGRLDVFTKGLDLLVEAVGEAARRGIATSLALVGPDVGGGRAQLERLARAEGVAGSLTFTGALDAAGVRERLADADVYVQPSRHDGFASSVAEALVAGLPAIVSTGVGISGFRDIASRSDVAIVEPVPSALSDAIVAAARAGDRQATSESGPAGVGLITWECIAALHLDRYAMLL